MSLWTHLWHGGLEGISAPADGALELAQVEARPLADAGRALSTRPRTSLRHSHSLGATPHQPLPSPPSTGWDPSGSAPSGGGASLSASLLSPLLGTVCLPCLRAFCLKNPEKTGGVRNPEHKAKYMFQAILLLCLPAALDPHPSSSAYALPTLPLGQLVSSYLMFKTQLPCPSPTAGLHSVFPCMVASLVQPHDGWLMCLAPDWAVASSGLRTTPCHFHVPGPRAEAHP